jgi:hypothetical protein
MEKATGARRQTRDESWLSAYRPRAIDTSVWMAVRPFVVECAGRLRCSRRAIDIRVVRELARLSVWAVGEGLPLDPEVVLDPDTIERFVASGLADDSSRATYRATLRRVGPLLTKRAPWEARPATVARRRVAMPYKAQELDSLRAAASDQPTGTRIRAARALLALGAGAGLDGRWVARVGPEDVTTTDGVVLVGVGEPAARVVPVLAWWQDEVVDLAATAGDECLVGGRSLARNRAGALAASIVLAHGHPKLSASRLRSTWLVTHLAMGTRLPELARAAGLQGVTVLSDLLPFVPALSEAEAIAMLQGRS